MYKDFYHLKTDPFSTHPDPDVIFISNTHKEAWYYLLFSMDTQEPYLVLAGEYGMGKTLLCLRLIQVLNKKGKPHVEYISTPNEGYGGILRRIASSVGISAISEDVSILQNMIYDYFRTHVENPRFYLIIDDAQELDQATLIRLKQFSTFNHNGFFPVSIIFVAHPSFLEALKTPALSSLNQRIKRRYHMSRFSFDDTKNYIYFRLLKSGATGIPAFPEESLQKIFKSSGGVPRLINNICDTCLLMGASNKLTSIPLSIVEQAVAMVEDSLVENEAEIHPVSEATDETKEGVSIAEPVQTGKDVKQDSLLTTLVDIEAGQSEKKREKAPGFGKRIVRVAMLTAAVLLLMSAGAVMFQLFLKDGLLSASFFHSNSPEKHQMIPKSPMPAEDVSHEMQPNIENDPVQRSDLEASSLQIEADPKTPVETSPSAGQTDIMTTDTVAPSSKDNSGADEQYPPKSEFLPSETTGSDFFYPYSLRSSSYQQPNRALQELAEIKKMGLTPYLVKVDLGDMGVWWRVYIGFYSSYEEAKRLKAIYNLSNVTIQKTDYACQLGEFSVETELLSMFERLKQSEYFPYVIQKGKDQFWLYVGAYERKTEAEFEHKNLLKNGFKNQIVKR
jgi:type II secretory pathway predicted ATPase ExeA/cell division septation protein DedD